VKISAVEGVPEAPPERVSRRRIGERPSPPKPKTKPGDAAPPKKQPPGDEPKVIKL
jgi:hypothetical protein